jgi:hypothetical protein
MSKNSCAQLLCYLFVQSRCVKVLEGVSCIHNYGCSIIKRCWLVKMACAMASNDQ